MTCPDCGGGEAHKEDCLAVRVARGDVTPREAQILRLEAAVPCPECGRGSPLGTHDCEAEPLCATTDCIYVEGYDRCIECGGPAPEPKIKFMSQGDSGEIGGARPSSAIVDEMVGAFKQGAGESWSGSFLRHAEALSKVGLSARAATDALTAHVGKAYGIPVSTDPAVPDGQVYVIDSQGVEQVTRGVTDPGDVQQAGDDYTACFGRDPAGFVTSPDTWMRFRDGVVQKDGRHVGSLINLDLT